MMIGKLNDLFKPLIEDWIKEEKIRLTEDAKKNEDVVDAITKEYLKRIRFFS